MSDIGQRLKEIRTKKNLSIEEVATGTGIRAQYLEALENSEYSNIPGDVFIKGFIRNYGNYLGLDGNALVDEYKKSSKITPLAEEVISHPDENVQAAVDAVEERNQQRTKPKSSLGSGIKNVWGDIKAFIYDNLYETVDDEEEEEAEPQVAAPVPKAPAAKPVAKEEPALEATRKIKFDLPVDTPKAAPAPVRTPPRKAEPVYEAPVREKKSFFNFKAFAGMFIVLLLIFCGVMAYFMLGSKTATSDTKNTKINTGVKSAHSTENAAAEGDKAKADDKKQATKQEDKAPSKEAKTTDKAKSDQDTVAVGEGDGVTVEITYKKPVWTQVTADGKGIEAATIPAGTTKVFKGNKEVKVNLGSIRDVTIKVNGKEVPYGEKEWGTVNKVFKK